VILLIIKRNEPLILDLWRITNKNIPFFVQNLLWIENHVLWGDEEHSFVLSCLFCLICFFLNFFLSFRVFATFDLFCYCFLSFSLFLSWLGPVNSIESTPTKSTQRVYQSGFTRSSWLGRNNKITKKEKII
jgi:hypothetical protein